MKKKFYAIHKWSGLIAGVFILLMGLSGSALVFHEEIQLFEHRTLLHVNSQHPVVIDKAYKAIAHKYPNQEIRLIKFSEIQTEALIFSVRDATNRLLVFSHPSTGKVLNVVNAKNTILNLILDLHYSFYAGYPGKVFVFVIGMVFLMSLVTGLIIYKTAVINTLLFKRSLINKSKRLLHSSLHHYIGVWALLLNILLAVTGTLIGFDNISSHSSTSATHFAAPVKVSTDSVLLVLKQRYPTFKPTYIRYPKGPESLLEINGKVKGEAFYWTQFYNKVEVNPLKGNISSLQLTSEAETGKKIASIVGVIHFAEFDNWLIKLLFCLAGLSAPALSVTGFFMWKLKRKVFFAKDR